MITPNGDFYYGEWFKSLRMNGPVMVGTNGFEHYKTEHQGDILFIMPDGSAGKISEDGHLTALMRISSNWKDS